MKVSRKFKKKIKKTWDYNLHPELVSRNDIESEGLFFWLFKNPCKRVANSTVFLDCPDRETLIKWWNDQYPESVEAKVVCKQNFLKHSVIMKENIIKNYTAHNKIDELKTIV